MMTFPLDDNLLGPRNITFINGLIVSTRIEHVIVNVYGDPIMLIDDQNVSYNWSTIMKVVKNLWM